MLAASQLGLDPFQVFHMSRDTVEIDGVEVPVNAMGEPLAGKPKNPSRYKRFLLACAGMAFEYQVKASGNSLQGTGKGKS